MGREAKTTEVKVCLKCGKQFQRRRFGDRLEDYTRFNNRRFCSKSCNLRAEAESRSAFHSEARKYAGSYCVLCGETNSLDVHHNDGNIRNNIPDNLTTLCHPCHMKLHWNQNDFRERAISNRKSTIAKKKE